MLALVLRILKNVLSSISAFFSRSPPSPSTRRFSALQLIGMDHIPNEILSHIFSLLMSQPDQDPVFSRTLSHVCSRWRHVSIAAGNLWARIHIFLPLSERQRIWTDVYLTRSTTYPLDILVDVRDPDWDWNETAHQASWQDMVPVVRLLILHSQRWQKFEMLADNWLPIFTFLFYTKTKLVAPMLRTLSLSRCNAYLAGLGETFQPENLRDPIPLLGGSESVMPSLSTVILVGVHVEWNKTVLRNLRHLEFKYQASEVMPTPNQFLSILEGCPDLFSLSIVGWGPRLDLSMTYPGMFFLPGLKELTFGFVDVNYAIRLFSLFHIPNLQSLVLEDINTVVSPVNIQNSTLLLDWLATSRDVSASTSSTPSTNNSIPIYFQSLQRLELRCIRAKKQAFSNFLSQLVSLQHLSYYNMLDDALDCLWSTKSGKSSYVCCPQLAQLHCVDVNVDALIRVVQMRAQDALLGSLRKVTIAFPANKRPAPDYEVLQNLTSAGVEVVVGSDSEG